LKPTSTFNSILVLCEGNHCRSPIAEAFFRDSLYGTGVEVHSAGLNALDGIPAEAEVMRLLKRDGIDISSHRSRQLTAAMALSSDLILVMDLSQKERCERMIPSTRGRVFLLGHWLDAGSREIADPFGRGPEIIKSTYEIIHRSVAGWLPHMILEQRSA